MDVKSGSGVVDSIKHAGLAAMRPIQTAPTNAEIQTVAGQKGDRITTTAEGHSTKLIIHDTVVQKRGEREYIRIKPYARLVARLGTSQPLDTQFIPGFNPFKLYSNPKPVAENGDGEAAPETVSDLSLRMSELEGGILPDNDGLRLDARQMARLIAERDELFAVQPFAMRPSILPESGNPESGNALLQQAAYRPDELAAPDRAGAETLPNTTFVAKTVEALADADETDSGRETKAVTVKRGDTLMSILAEAGAEKWQAKAIADAMAPVFRPKNLKKGQEVRLTLMPTPKNETQLEPVKISLFTGGAHEVTVVRNEAGEFVSSTDPVVLKDAKNQRRSKSPQRATLYTSFFNAALSQGISRDKVMKLLRIHSYDTDFKRAARAGDGFEVFYSLEKDQDGQDTAMGEVLFTSMISGGGTRKFYRFRTPDGEIDFYDRDGNSAKKFLMRRPVKGARFTSAFGMRLHPILGYKKMHTGNDWAAKRGTPVLAGGNGVVEEIRRKGGRGNFVRIRHANGFQTTYSHMAGFAKGLRTGMKIKIGQVVGYVGSTGLSTGSHLHYEVLVNNRFVNPMTIHVPRGRQLAGKMLANFYKERNRIDELMQSSPVTTRMAAVQN